MTIQALSISQGLLDKVHRWTGVQTNNGRAISALKTLSGPILKVALAAEAFFEAMACFLVGICLYPFFPKTCAKTTKRTQSAAKTLFDALGFRVARAQAAQPNSQTAPLLGHMRQQPTITPHALTALGIATLILINYRYFEAIKAAAFGSRLSKLALDSTSTLSGYLSDMVAAVSARQVGKVPKSGYHTMTTHLLDMLSASVIAVTLVVCSSFCYRLYEANQAWSKSIDYFWEKEFSEFSYNE